MVSFDPNFLMTPITVNLLFTYDKIYLKAV